MKIGIVNARTLLKAYAKGLGEAVGLDYTITVSYGQDIKIIACDGETGEVIAECEVHDMDLAYKMIYSIASTVDVCEAINYEAQFD